ncbi:MAG: AAA family ATPase [Bacteroidia bacterium]
MIEPTENEAVNEESSVIKIPKEIEEIGEAVAGIKAEIAKFIIGQEEQINYLIAGLFIKGHILLEGVPGIAKTYLAKIFSQTIDSGFSRIQFTPDLMPSDIIGTNIFNLKSSEFMFKKGPVFSNIVLIDEINRAPAKTQSALFEVMQEQQITLDGNTYNMEEPFMVLGTQNPIEQEGTYKLPEAQLDRFIFRIKMGYPSLDDEILILQRFKDDFEQRIILNIKPILNGQKLAIYRKIIENILIKDELVRYIARIVNETRHNPDLYLGASTRASLGILKTSKAIAAMNGRNFVIPEDIQQAAYPVLNHRIILTPEREMEGLQPEDVIKDMLAKIEVPR